MASVSIDSGPVDAKDRLRDVPPTKWHDLMLARCMYLDIHLASDCRCLVEFVNDAKEMYAALGFPSVEDMIRDGYGLDPHEIALAVEWLELRKPGEAIGLLPTIQLARRGRPKKGEGKGVHHTLTRGTGNRAYILARLDRDGHGELAAKVRAGQLSANAAAKQAGFRKEQNALDRILKLLPQLSALDRCKLRAALADRNGERAA